MSTSTDMVARIQALVDANCSIDVKAALGSGGDAWEDDAAMTYIIQGIAEIVDTLIPPP